MILIFSAYHYKKPGDTGEEGHGSNVQGIATGSHGIGVAPGAMWITAKIYNFAGSVFCGVTIKKADRLFSGRFCVQEKAFEVRTIEF